MNVIEFTVPMRLPLMNKLLRMHFRARHRVMNQLAWEVKAAAKAPAVPFARCEITIERESPQEPDQDGLTASVKGLLDVLQPVSLRHPLGLGFIANDSPACIRGLEVRHIPGKGAKTRVIIREVV